MKWEWATDALRVKRDVACIDFAKTLGYHSDETAKLMTLPPPCNETPTAAAEEGKIEELGDGEYLVTYSHPFRISSKFFAHTQTITNNFFQVLPRKRPRMPR